MNHNIKMDLGRIMWEAVDWIHLVQYKNQWWALLNRVTNRWVLQKTGHLLTSLVYYQYL
jgi:uncharacterized protein YpuA (DUF1002 family)